MRAGQVGTRINPALPQGRQLLARTLGVLHAQTGARTLNEAVSLLGAHGYTTNASAVSRYLNGGRVPPLQLVTVMYDLALAAAGSEAGVGLTKDEAIAAHGLAEPTLCSTCSTLRNDNEALRSDNSGLHEENERLRAAEAGLQEALAAARRRSASLPVPRFEGDRQRLASDVAGATKIASAASHFRQEGQVDAALAVLADTAGRLTPVEAAVSLAALRSQQQSQLADTLGQMYAREHSEREVIQVALELHQRGMLDDATSILRAAVR
ncbi:hypothetical protein [Streptomyces xanthochromogenes]|uniref:Uncharacterized protein n=1 Tax=Streptomyces xanthochromogenes TaxID=67384 RepID=A0ABQ2ZRE1_9ACTN|nr:hypothetical protein [Streptomyces xanthochromogenes]GGY21543.1 hypothetical protein GCM10010326_13050 [Streptomyces xanthochromogenes]